MEWSLTARWVFPVDGPPLLGGVITIRDGRIVAVEPKGARTADRDLGNVALIPGLVNPHTHLDLTGLRGRTPPSEDFTGWLRQVIAHRRQTTPDQARKDIHEGIGLSAGYGTMLVGDISADGLSVAPLSTSPLRSVVYHEMLGLSQDRARHAWHSAQTWLSNSSDTEYCHRGLSPHAPYSVGKWLFGQAAALSDDFPMAIHVGETRAELDLMAHHSGPFVAFLRELNVWDPDRLVKSVDDVLRSFCATRLLVVHANYLMPDQIPCGATVVYCPRTHAAFGHPPHPFRDFLKAGIRVALGTDSLASNPDLDVFAEAQFVHQRHPDVAGADLLRMITLSGAEALGWADVTGSLTPGKSADIVGIPLRDQDDDNPYRLLFDAPGGNRVVVFQGRIV